MGRLRVGLLDAIDLDCFKRTSNSLLLGLDALQLFALRDHDLIQLIAEMFEMCKVRFDSFQAR